MTNSKEDDSSSEESAEDDFDIFDTPFQGGSTWGQVSRRPNVPDISSSEDESEEEEQKKQLQQLPPPRGQPGQEPDEDNIPASIKEELSSSEYEDDNEEVGEASQSQEVQMGSQLVSTPQALANQTNENSAPRSEARVILRPVDFQAFEEEHIALSAPVVDIPPDSDVWFLQIPRTISASHLKGLKLPAKLNGEVLNLPTGQWQILEQPYIVPMDNVNCITSTGDLSYKLHWLQPKVSRMLKRFSAPVHLEGGEQSWEDITPIPVEELLKMKSKVSLQVKHSKKRSRESHSNQVNKLASPSKNTDSKLHSPHKKKKRMLYSGQDDYAEISMIDNEERGKKRKRPADSSEVSPTKKKKKYSLGENGLIERINVKLESLESSHSDVNVSMNSATDRDSSFSKKKKKRHRDCEGDKSYSESNANESFEVSGKKKKKKKKQEEKEETMQTPEKKKKLSSDLSQKTFPTFIKEETEEFHAVEKEDERTVKESKKKRKSLVKEEVVESNEQNEEHSRMNKKKKKHKEKETMIQ